MQQNRYTEQVEVQLTATARGWPPGAPCPYVLASMIGKHLGSRLSSSATHRDVFSFTADLTRIRLKGMEDVPVLLVGGNDPVTADRVRTFVRSELSPGSFALVLVTNDDMFSVLTSRTSGQRCVLLDRDKIRGLLASDSPLEFLTTEIRSALPTRSLIPYDILLSADGNMFYGRTNESRRLREEETTCFAIAGPGRAGKTSLVKSYLRWLKQERPSMNMATYYIDLMECADKTADGYARFISSRISSKSLDGVDCDGFLPLLRSIVAQTEQPLTLVLDEIDDFCLDNRARDMLAHAARQSLARLIVCGKGDLFRTMVGGWSHFASRIELLRLGQLDDTAARKLLTEPLSALGFSFADPCSVDEVLGLTGRFPHLIQFYARRLVEHSLNQQVACITRATIDALQWDYHLSRYIVSPLDDLRDPGAKFVALTLLRDDSKDVWTASDVTMRIEGLGMGRANDLLNELVIGNILAWHGGAFRVANKALKLYAQQSGYLGQEFEVARRAYVDRIGKSH